jgi:hypothetical protein
MVAGLGTFRPSLRRRARAVTEQLLGAPNPTPKARTPRAPDARPSNQPQWDARSGGAILGQIHDQARPPDQQLVAVGELLFAADADENARARAEIGEHDCASLFFDQAVLLADERIVGKHQITDRGAHLQCVATRDDTAAVRAAFEDLQHTERRRPFRR